MDNPVAMINVSGTSETWYYYYADALGSVRLLTDGGGTIVESYTYDAYGQPRVMTAAGDGNWLTEDAGAGILSASAVGNPYLFTARRWDSTTRLYYYRFRDYAPKLGRFLQTDPAGYIDTMNLYAYCGNNPVNWIDPWGLCKEGDYIDAEDILKKGRNTPYNPFRHAGDWDFAYTDEYAGEKFRLPDGTIMNANEFANYMAGYMGGYHLGDFGYVAMRGMGHLYELTKTGNEHWLDDPESVRDINRGYDDGVDQKYEDYGDFWDSIIGLF